MDPTVEKIKLILQSQYDIITKSIEIMSEGIENCNYHIIDSIDNEWTAKWYRVKNNDEARIGIEMLEKLEETSFPSPKVKLAKSGASLIELNGRPLVVLHFIQGHHVAALDDHDLFKIGALLGELHNNLKEYSLPEKEYDWDFNGIQTLLKMHTDNIIHKKFPDAEVHTTFLKNELAKLHFSKLPVGATHQDVKPDNILRKNDNTLAIIDFDNGYNGVLLVDLLTPVIWTCFESGELVHEHMNIIIAGYTSKRTLTDSEKNELMSMLKFRLLREAFIWMWLYNNDDSHDIALGFIDAYKKL